MVIVFDAELWIWDARRGDSWTFVSLPAEESETVRDMTEGVRRGFGSLRVRARIGATTWTTSIFPDKGRAAYVLPVKKAVRRAQHLDPGHTTTVEVELLDL
ncbi:DUF1905 domain-containing protein [Actinoplanes sp. NPDC049681]|uniref:DUF1905 domain-containing protein n=1 Tax=Actinoplanes sp. NPDC049681 TaxID=3363905 RepID=UPI00378C9083